MNAPRPSIVFDWLSVLQKSASTVENYTRDLRQITSDVSVRLGYAATAGDLLELTTEAIADLVRLWRDGGAAPATVRRRLVSLRQYGKDLFRTVGAAGPLLYATFPVIDVPSVDSEEIEVSDLLEHGVSSDWVNARDNALVAITIEHGLTTGELSLMRSKHALGSNILVGRAGQSLRVRTLSSEAEAAVNRYQELCPFQWEPEGPLWFNARGGPLSTRSIQIMVRKRRESAGLPPTLVTGSLRRIRIRELAACGTQPYQIAVLMGIGVETVLHHLRE